MNNRFSSRITEAYGRYSQKYAAIRVPILKPMADEIVRLCKLKGGEQVLDLATGTGLVARTGAHFAKFIIGIDFSLGILERAKSLSAETIPFITGDAHKLPFPDEGFDIVTCGLGLSHFVNISIVLGEILRVLHSNGLFVTSVWGGEGEDPSNDAAVKVQNKFLEEKELSFGGTLAEELWADEERGIEILRKAGFTNVQVTTLQLSGMYRNPFDATEVALASPLTQYRIAKLSLTDQQKFREETTTAILEVDDLRWKAEIHCYQAVATKHLKNPC